MSLQPETTSQKITRPNKVFSLNTRHFRGLICFVKSESPTVHCVSSHYCILRQKRKSFTLFCFSSVNNNKHWRCVARGRY